MKIYIRATGNISPQNTFGHLPLLKDLVIHQGNRMACIEPEYKDLIDVKLIRRMSRIIKMGVAAATECLHEASMKMPDSVITGTAYGCLEDTGIFLGKMVDNKEELLTPTAFIQSTHNTVGAQVALMLGCHGYNNTFVHRGFSFESALLDAMMLMMEREASNVLVGSVDEITDLSHSVLSRFGLYKKETASDRLYAGDSSRGTMAGEGAAFFLLSDEPSSTDYGYLDGIAAFYKPADTGEIEEQIKAFLASRQLTMEDIDLVITGRNGDSRGDQVYEALSHSVFNNKISANYKNLCGEYPTSTSFAMWLAAWIVKTGQLPTLSGIDKSSGKPVKKILVYNHYEQIHHSLLLIAAC